MKGNEMTDEYRHFVSITLAVSENQVCWDEDGYLVIATDLLREKPHNGLIEFFDDMEYSESDAARILQVVEDIAIEGWFKSVKRKR